jgi:steroid delta-isomerase-like uncharacterized protein
VPESRRQSDANKAHVRELNDTVQNDGRIEETERFFHPDFVDRTPMPGTAGGVEGAKQIFTMLRHAFPDHDCQVHFQIAEGDLVATYKTFTGTHKEEFLGVPATGKRVTIRVMDFLRLEDGGIAEHWNVVDVAGLMHQLGEGAGEGPAAPGA